jgi:hypothetical protein
MARPARDPGSIIGRGTRSLQQSSTSPSAALVEASGSVSRARSYDDATLPRGSYQASRGDGNGSILSVPVTPPGSVVFRPAAPASSPYPRFIRQLSPNEALVVHPDEDGRWPRLRPDAIAEPIGGRHAVAWNDRQPSKTAYANWLRDSAPIQQLRIAAE